MGNIDGIKDTVRKLMSLATDNKAGEAEIETALRMAAKLMDRHHLTNDDIGSREEADADAADLTMGRVAATTQTTRFSTWESTLGGAILDLIGCINWYISHETAPVRVNGVAVIEGDEVKRGKRIYFYGPAKESAEAAELFEEWSRVIATMGVARWGGCFRGDGAMYCNGFADAVARIARKINRERQLTAARPLPQLAGETSTAITLSGRFDLLKKEAEVYLEKDHGIKLHTRSASSGYSAGSQDAYNEGKSHGEKSGFARKSGRKMLGS